MASKLLKEGKMKKRILLVLFFLLLVIPLIQISCQKEEDKWKENTDELEELIE
jgi:hypothetical protein